MRPPPRSFRDYVMTRPYGFGRGRADSWSFITFARGDDHLPEARSWRDVRAYLEKRGRPDLVPAARIVWGSYGIQKRRLDGSKRSRPRACENPVQTDLRQPG